MKNNLKHRTMKAEQADIPENPLDRSRLLKSLLVTKNKLENRKAETLSVINEAKKEIRQYNKTIKLINKKIEKLKPEDGFVVTEHALLRYIERYMGVDIEKVHADVLSLPGNNKIMANNTVVTVYPDQNDHFNLAGNERKVMQ